MNLEDLRSALIGQPKVSYGTIWTIADIRLAMAADSIEITYTAGDTYWIQKVDSHLIKNQPLEFFQKLFSDNKLLETRLYRLIA